MDWCLREPDTSASDSITSKILISYRREDSAHVTGRIYDRLVQQFGRTAVFKDVDSIPLGIDFRTYLDQQVAKCDVFLAVIGRNWMKPQGQKGKSRLADPADFVRLEIEAALKRQIPVIPVLVEGASIPPVDRLPTSLQGLSYRNGIVVRPDSDFHRDMDRLIDHLRAQGEGQQTHGPHPETPHPATDVSLTTTMTDPEVEPPEQAHIEAAVLPSKVTPPQQLVEPIEEGLATSTGTYQKTTDQSSSYLLGVIGLIVLIGGVAAFLILQPPSRPVEPIRYEPPQVVEKKEERPAQVTPSPAPPRPSEPTVVPKQREKPVEKRVETSRSSIPTPEMVRISPGSFMMGDRRSTRELIFTKSTSPDHLRWHGMRRPLTSTTALLGRRVAHSQRMRGGGVGRGRSSMCPGTMRKPMPSGCHNKRGSGTDSRRKRSGNMQREAEGRIRRGLGLLIRVN